MDGPKLPEHLGLLLTEEPVFDLYSHGPWRVPDGLYEEIRHRANTLNSDPRAEEFDVELPDFYAGDTTVVGAELWCLLEFLIGSVAVRGGSRCDIAYETMSDFVATPRNGSPRESRSAGTRCGCCGRRTSSTACTPRIAIRTAPASIPETGPVLASDTVARLVTN